MSGASKVQVLAIALKAAMVLAGLCSTASAQVAKVSAKKCNGITCTISMGTCVNIGTRDGRAYFLTAGHVIAGSNNVSIHLRGGQIEARIDAVDKEPDLGLISLPDKNLEGPFALADEVAETSFEFVGFTGGRPFTKRQAHKARRSNGMLIALCPIDHGDSGGPFLDGQERVVGIVWGSDGREGYATDCISIRRWLNARVGFVPCPPPRAQPVPQRPQPVPPANPTPAPPPPQVTCGCAFEIATLKAEIAALKAKCNAPAPPPPPPPALPTDLTDRLDELERQIAAAAIHTKRIADLEFKIESLRIQGGDTEQLKKELAALRDLTFEVRSLAPDGKVVSSETKRLGDNIDLRLVPKRQN